MRPKGIYFTGRGWVNPAPSTDIGINPNRTHREASCIHSNLLASKGLLGFPPSGYEIPGLNERFRGKSQVTELCDIDAQSRFARQWLDKSEERMRLACWRWRPRHRELFPSRTLRRAAAMSTRG